MINTILQVSRIEAALFDDIRASFGNLPESEHVDGNYRLRRYSRARAKLEDLVEGGSVHQVEGNVFNQSEEYNKHQGGLARQFENVEESTMTSAAMRELTIAFFEACKLHGEHDFEIHQFRMRCIGGATQVAPEGWHQDGYDHVALVGVCRENIIGGEILLSASKTEAPFFTATLDRGTMVVIKDNVLWHNARAIQAIDDEKSAWLDLIVLTIQVNGDR